MQVAEWQDGNNHTRCRFEACDEPVALALDRLDNAGTDRVIVQRSSNLTDGCIDTAGDLDEHIATPETFNDLISSDDLATTSDEQHQQFQRDVLEIDRATTPPQLIRGDVELERTKPKHAFRYSI